MTTLTNETDILDQSNHTNMNTDHPLEHSAQSHVEEIINYVAHHIDVNDTSIHRGEIGTTVCKATPLDTVQGELDLVRRSNVARCAAPNNLTIRSDRPIINGVYTLADDHVSDQSDHGTADRAESYSIQISGQKICQGVIIIKIV